MSDEYYLGTKFVLKYNIDSLLKEHSDQYGWGAFLFVFS
jgi:hypothetical protein